MVWRLFPIALILPDLSSPDHSARDWFVSDDDKIYVVIERCNVCRCSIVVCLSFSTRKNLLSLFNAMDVMMLLLVPGESLALQR